VAITRREPDADSASNRRGLASDEGKLDLHRIGIRVAGPDGLEDCSRVIALRHEQLGGVVDIAVLQGVTRMSHDLLVALDRGEDLLRH
jgi:hypothetical protein